MASSTPDISQLTTTQQESLQNYTSITDQDPISAIPILQRSEWNVQIAVARFYDSEPVTDPVEEARSSLPTASTRQTTNLQYEALLAASHPGSSQSPPADTVQRIDAAISGETHYHPPLLLSAFLAPFSVAYRLLATVFSPFTFLIPSFIHRVWVRFTQQQARPTRRTLPPADNARRFIRESTEEYGSNNIPFVETGFNLALDNAKRDLKFLLVILLSPSHDANSSWVGETLLSAQLSTFFASHREELTVWGGNVHDSEAYQVSESLRCTKFPFVALICHNPSAGSSSTGMSTIMRAVGALSASDLVAKLATSMTGHQAQLSATRAQRAEQQASRSLRQEQDSAYERSLAQDRERARQKKEEQERQARAEKEALASAEAAEQRQQDEQQWKQWRAQSFSLEPEANARDSTRVSIRLPSGDRVIRRFRTDADLEDLYVFVECYDIIQSDQEQEKPVTTAPVGYQHEYHFQLVAPMPRKVFSLDAGGSIADTVGKGANLIVEPLDTTESDGD